MRSALNFRTNEGDGFFIARFWSRAMSVSSILLLFSLFISTRLWNPRLITHVQGFDEFMNVVIDDAAEVYVKDAKPRRELGVSPISCCIGSRTDFGVQGRILLKGDNITLIQQVV